MLATELHRASFFGFSIVLCCPASTYPEHGVRNPLGSIAYVLTMSFAKAREQRRMVMVKARMRVTTDWADVTICNVSSRGLMAKCNKAPARGSYVEIRQRGACIVGRVAWSQGMRFGIRTQDPIDISALLAEPTIKGKRALNDRRIDARKPAPTILVVPDGEKAERSRRFSRAFEWGVIVAASAFGVSQLAAVTGEALGDPLQKAKRALAVSR